MYKPFALILVFALLLSACNNTGNSNTSEPAAETGTAAETADEPEAVLFTDIEIKPMFNGGDANEFAKWAYSQIKYPEPAINDQTQGRVVVRFTIGTDGEVRDVELIRGVREDLDAEALRVVSSSPKWKPGMINGKNVPVSFVFPIVFKLQ